jgi:hypothetical protein
MSETSTNRSRQVVLADKCFATVDRLIHDYLGDAPADSIPIPIEQIAEHVGVRRVVRTTLPHSGRLIPVNGRYVVEINSREDRARQRFTLAHELGHIVISNTQGEMQEESVQFLRCERDNFIEKLCDKIAGRMLMPDQFVRSELEKVDLTLPVLSRLAKFFGVSLSAIAVRLTEVSNRFAFLRWEYGSRPGSERMTYRVSWFATPPGSFIPKHVPCKLGCVVEASASNGPMQRVRTPLDVGTFRGNYEVDVRPLASNDLRGVLMLIRIGSRA